MSPVYANSWTELISTRRSKTTNNKEKGRLRLSLRKWGISGWIATTITEPWGILLGQSRPTSPQGVNTVFRESMHQVLEKIKNEPYFKWPNKMSGDPLRRNQSLHCQYHQERGHTTEDCRTLWNHLDQLVKKGKVRGSRERFFKALVRHNQCPLWCIWENWFSTFQGNFYSSDSNWGL